MSRWDGHGAEKNRGCALMGNKSVHPNKAMDAHQ